MSDYELLSLLGQGAMGRVHRARHTQNGREVALKVLHETLHADADLQARFRREIAVCARLDHPAIIHLHDAGEMDGHAFFTMELLEGALPLSTLLEDGPLELETAVDVMRALLDALAYCHGKDVIHRDIKPANLMLGPAARVTLMDFGLVRQANSTLLTKPGMMLGTPRYLSPETILGEVQGKASDLWSAGAMFYEMLTGRAAFPGQTIPDIVRDIVHSEPTPVSRALTHLPVTLDPLVARFLAKDPKDRYPDAEEAIHALDAWSARQGVAAPEAVMSAARLRRPVSHRAAKRKSGGTTPRPPRPARGRTAAQAVAISGILAALVACALVVGSTRRAPAVVAASAIPAVVASRARAVPSPTSLSEAGSRLRHRLQLFDAVSTLRWSSQEMERFAGRGHREGLTPTLRSAWTGNVTHRLETSRLSEAVEQFMPVRDAYFLSPDIAPEAKRALYEQIQPVIELFDGMKLVELPVPFDARLLESVAYGYAPGPLDAPLAGYGVVLDESRSARELLFLTPGSTLETGVASQGRLKSFADLRFAEGGERDMSLIANHAYTHPRPLPPLAGAGAIELRVVLERTDPPVGVRFYTAPATNPEAQAVWQLLAFVRSHERRRTHVVRHQIPDGILPSVPYLLRIELAYVPARSVVKGNTQQDSDVHAFAIGRPGQR